MNTNGNPLDELAHFPLLRAIFGRRARRFGLGMSIPSGPLAYTSKEKPMPLSELEQALLVAAGTGVTGWNLGVPYSPGRPEEHGHFTVRYTGRTAPTAAGIGSPALLYSDDSGIYLTNTRDVQPDDMLMYHGHADEAERIMAVCREHTVQLSDRRLDVPATPPHMLEPNLWMVNTPGSTFFAPVTDLSEEMMGIMGIAVGHGYMTVDPDTGKPAGDLAPFVRSGLLDESKPFPLTSLEQLAYEGSVSALSFMGHNIVLTLQAMGLGGLFFGGMNRLSVMGALAEDGIRGLGFRFVRDGRWPAPNPVGLDGHYEALCPPYYDDMRAAVEAFVERKFGPGGAYDPETPGPWIDSARVKRSVTPYSDEFVACMAETAQYIYDKYGKVPGTAPTILIVGYVQAHHLDTDYYDAHYKPGAYLETHAEHMRRWHGEGA
jgi:hypothetical protein